MTVKEFKQLFSDVKEIRVWMCGERDVTNHPDVDKMIVIGSGDCPDGSVDLDVVWW